MTNKEEMGYYESALRINEEERRRHLESCSEEEYISRLKNSYYIECNRPGDFPDNPKSYKSR